MFAAEQVIIAYGMRPMAVSSGSPAAGEMWRLDTNAALALAPLGSPFADSRFITALVQSDQQWTGHAVGAVAPDNTRASITLACNGSEAVSVPFGYGGIIADRSLEARELEALLRLVTNSVDVSTITIRSLSLPVRGRPSHACGKVIAATALVTLTASEDLFSHLTKKARQSIRRAERGGVVVEVGADPKRFLDLYAAAARRRQMVYPTRLLELVAASGMAQIYDALVGGETVASAFALTGGVEWMYWQAAQNDLGRRLEAGYPVLAQLLMDARDHGARFVNLGASAGLPGVAKFKRRMAGSEFPVIENAITTSRLRLARSWVVRGLAHGAEHWRGGRRGQAS